MDRHQVSTAITLAIVLTNAGHNVGAQDWPRRAVTMFAAGGPADAQGRMLARHLSDFLHQSVILENVVGAGSMACSAPVAKAAPDGYQILLGGTNTLVFLGGRELAPLLQKLPPGKPSLQIAQFWSNRMPLESGMAIAGWLVNHGVLVGQANRGGAPS